MPLKKFYLYIYYPLFIIFSLFLINYVGHRFPHQDLMVNDLWAINRLTFFWDAFNYNFFSVVNFSEGFGVDIRSNIKTQLPTLDISFLFSIFMSEKNAIFFKIATFVCIGFFSMHQLLSKISNSNKTLFLSLIFALSIQFFSETSSLTTGAYALTPLMILMLEKFIKKSCGKNLIYFFTTSFFYISNLDLNAIFIIPLIILWVVGFKFKELLSIKVIYCVSIIILIFFTVNSGSIIFYFQNVLETTKNNMLYWNWGLAHYHLKILLKSNFVPYMVGPITLFFFPPIIIYCFAGSFRDKENLKIITITLFSILFFLLPNILPFLKEYIPSIVRYHFAILGILIFISTSKILLNLDQSLIDNKKFSRFYYIYVSIIILSILDFSQSIFFGFGAIISLVGISYIIKSKDLDYSHLKYFSLPILQLLFVFFLFNGGTHSQNVRVLDSEYSKFYLEKLNSCIGKFVKNKGVIPIAEHDLFPDTGRHDLLLPILELPNQEIGRSFYQWRHYYPKITSDLYLYSGAKGSEAKTNFFPASKTAVSQKEFWDFVEISKIPFIASINIDIKKNNWVEVGYCKSDKVLKSNFNNPDYKKSLTKSFMDKVVLYKKLSEQDIEFEYFNTHVNILNPKKKFTNQLRLPIIYHDDLITNFPNSIEIVKSQKGFTILKLLNNDFKFSKDSKIVISSHNVLIHMPLYLTFFLTLLIILCVRFKLFPK